MALMPGDGSCLKLYDRRVLSDLHPHRSNLNRIFSVVGEQTRH